MADTNKQIAILANLVRAQSKKLYREADELKRLTAQLDSLIASKKETNNDT